MVLMFRDQAKDEEIPCLPGPPKEVCMVGLYIGATSSFAGKNMVTLGLGLKLQQEGYNLGYMKPVGALPRKQDGSVGDDDAFFIQDVLSLKADPGLVTPVVVDHDFKVKAFSGQCGDLMGDIKQAYTTLGRDKDLMLVAGSGSMYSGKYCNVDGVTLTRELGLKVVVIDRYKKELNYDTLVVLREVLGERMLGVVLNDIPPAFMDELQKLIIPFLERSGVKVLGVIQNDPLMSAIKVGDLAEKLGGKLLTAQEQSDRVVENFLIGTMQVENFMTHFRRSKSSAIIVGGDRSDVQLVALEGKCQCLVLTGNLYPNDIILTRAEVLEVPIVVVREDTYSVAKRMEAILSRHKLRDVVKIKQGLQLVSQAVDLESLKKGLGI